MFNVHNAIVLFTSSKSTTEAIEQSVKYVQRSQCRRSIYLFKVNNKNMTTRSEICSKLTIKIPEQRQWHRSGVFIVNFEHISDLVLVFLLLTLDR